MPRSLDQLKAMGKDGLLKMTKDKLADSILDATGGTAPADLSAITAHLVAQTDALKMLTNRIDTMSRRQEEVLVKLKDVQTELKKQKEENQLLRSEHKELVDIVAGHQRIFEKLDAKERAQKLIVMGVSESDWQQDEGDGTTSTIVDNDKSKLDLIFDTISCTDDADGYEFQRLGAARDNQLQPRNILVTLPTDESRTKILENAKLLNPTGEPYKSVRLKKDSHPCLRAEWKRLFESFDIEKKKPENSRANMEFDKRKRVITRDGVIIDSFMAHFR